jgi:pimeloyl-ACP methyl ester carboxylesterase
MQILRGLPADLKGLLRPEFQSPNHFTKSGFGQMARQVSAYQRSIRTPLMINIGTKDEVVSIEVGMLGERYQAAVGDTSRVRTIVVEGGTHRGTFAVAVARQKGWFDSLIAAGR